jgi:AcrR family transcriptional regulator
VLAVSTKEADGQGRVPKTKRLPRDERRRQLIDAAVPVFARRGYHATRMEDVASAAGINVAILYRHFPDKEGLFDAILGDMYRERPLTPHLAELIAGDDDEAVFQFFAERYANLNERDLAIERLLLFTSLERPELYRRHFEDLESVPVGLLADYLARRTREGAFPPHDPRIAARAFSSTMYFYLVETRMLAGGRWAGYARKPVLDFIVTTFLHGLRNAG